MLRSFIGGLGGKDISATELDHVIDTLESTDPERGPYEPELLMTQGEIDQVNQRLTVAGKPVTVEVS